MSFFSSGMGDGGFGNAAIWSQGVAMFAIESPVNDLLAKDDVTLEQLLEEDELLQEVKSMNPKLLDFFGKVENVRKMVEYITVPFKPEDTDNRKFRYPYMACEVICCDISQVTDAVAEGENGSLLDQLFSILDLPPPLDPHLAGYVDKVCTLLLQRRPDPLTKYLNSRGIELFHRFMKHLDSFSIAQLTKKLLQPPGFQDESMGMPLGMMGGMGEGMGMSLANLNSPSMPTSPIHVSWHDDPAIIDSLVALIQVKDEEGNILRSDVHDNASEIIVEIVQHSGRPCHLDPDNAHDNQTGLMSHLLREETLDGILNAALPLTPLEQGQSSSSVVAGLTVLAAVLSIYVNTHYMNQPSEETVPRAIEMTLERIPRVCEELKNADCGSVRNQLHEEKPRLGIMRLKLVYLIGLLLNCKLHRIDEVISKERALDICLDLFFQFPWANMLHSYIEGICATVVESTSEVLLRSLFTDAKLFQRILDAYKENEELKAKEEPFLKGYMGHLHRIARILQDGIEDSRMSGDEIRRESYTSDDLLAVMQSDPKWEDWQQFVKTTLQEVELVESTPIGGPDPAAMGDSFGYGNGMRGDGLDPNDFTEPEVDHFFAEEMNKAEEFGFRPRIPSEDEVDTGISFASAAGSDHRGLGEGKKDDSDGFDTKAFEAFDSDIPTLQTGTSSSWSPFDDTPNAGSPVNASGGGGGFNSFSPFNPFEDSASGQAASPSPPTSTEDLNNMFSNFESSVRISENAAPTQEAATKEGESAPSPPAAPSSLASTSPPTPPSST